MKNENTVSIVFQHKRTRKQVGINLIIIAFVMPLSPWLVLHLTGNSESIFNANTYVYLGAGVVLIGLISTAIWNFMNPAMFRFTVTNDSVESVYPNNERLTYKVPLFDIVAVECRTETKSSDSLNLAQYFIIMKSGDDHQITINYRNPVGKIQKKLLKMNPQIEIRNRKIYSSFQKKFEEYLERKQIEILDPNLFFFLTDPSRSRLTGSKTILNV